MIMVNSPEENKNTPEKYVEIEGPMTLFTQGDNDLTVGHYHNWSGAGGGTSGYGYDADWIPGNGTGGYGGWKKDNSIPPFDSTKAYPLPYIVTTTTGKFEEDPVPKKNVYKDSNGNLHLDIEVTGYDKDMLEVMSQGQQVTVKFHDKHMSEFVDDEDELEFIEQEIVQKSFNFIYNVPSTHDTDKMTAKRVENGLLKMVFPPKEEKKHEF